MINRSFASLIQIYTIPSVVDQSFVSLNSCDCMVVMVVVLVVRVDVGVRRAEGDIFAGKPVILGCGLPSGWRP